MFIFELRPVMRRPATSTSTDDPSSSASTTKRGAALAGYVTRKRAARSVGVSSTVVS